LAGAFTNYSIIACIVILVVLMTMGVVASTINPDTIDASETLSVGGLIVEKIPENINLFVVLVVVAIPEGLPLTIQISLAFSVMRMFRQDRILLRKQDALEKIAAANEFIIGKSNILTTGKMKVKQFHLEGKTK
jgi:Ca2+-transporting ATPase